MVGTPKLQGHAGAALEATPPCRECACTVLGENPEFRQMANPHKIKVPIINPASFLPMGALTRNPNRQEQLLERLVRV
jgi:hypothetical protein